MSNPNQSRFEKVSRRALLKGTLGSGLLALTAAACGNADAQVLAGNVAEATTTTTTTTTEAPTTTAQEAAEADGSTAESVEASGPAAVVGEMIVAFTYTRVGEGKVESPYVAVWVEDANGDLLETIALFYQQERRGERWLDHLIRWFPSDAARITAGGQDVAATISSATQPPGSYAVTWDGTVAGTVATAGDFFICIESTREDGPYSLIREPITLNGSLPVTSLADVSELSLASVQINA